MTSCVHCGFLNANQFFIYYYLLWYCNFREENCSAMRELEADVSDFDIGTTLEIAESSTGLFLPSLMFRNLFLTYSLQCHFHISFNYALCLIILCGENDK